MARLRYNVSVLEMQASKVGISLEKFLELHKEYYSTDGVVYYENLS